MRMAAMNTEATAIIIMSDALQMTLLRLMTWLSPAFPIGAFSYSHGLERAVHDGLAGDRATLIEWLTDLVNHGSAWNDAVLLAAAWRSDGDGVEALSELAEAMAGARERHMETMLQGEAFSTAVAAWPGQTGTVTSTAYPVAVGAAARCAGIALEPALAAHLHGFASNLVQAAVRLVPLGQTDGVAAMAALEGVILETASRAAASDLDDLGSATVMSEIVTMKHETQYSRVFRS